MTEKRLHPRVVVKADINVKIQSSPTLHELEHHEYKTHVLDISFGGLMLKLVEPTPIGILLELKIRLEEADTDFWFTGSVVWNESDVEKPHESNPYHFAGIQFNSPFDNPQFPLWKETISKMLLKQTENDNNPERNE
jgi:hypothetical protein